jgi:RNA polymerase sigma-70 factor (ECF subfamily)
MATSTSPNSSATHAQLLLAAQGDQGAWAKLLDRHQDRLRRMISLRLDQRLQGRIDPEDVLQDTYLEAAVHLADYIRQPAMPFFF